MADLLSLPYEALCDHIESLGEPRMRGRQIFRALQRRGVASFEAATDLPKSLREKLALTETLTALAPSLVLVAKDKTRKFQWTLHDGRRVESVLIPDGDNPRSHLQGVRGEAPE